MKFLQLVKYNTSLVYDENMISVENLCPDRGLQAIETLGHTSIYYVLGWMIALLSIEQSCHVFMLFFQKFREIKYTFCRNPFQFPVGVSLLWVLFTALSHILVAFTWRSNAAILAKSLHVVTETLFLIQISTSFGFYLFSSVCSVVITIVLLLVVALPCTVTVTPASYSGIVLDTINFLAYTMYGFGNKDNKILWKAIAAFGLHWLYLITFTFVEIDEIQLGKHTLASLRIFGAYMNYFAGEVFINIAHTILYKSNDLKQDTRDWFKRHTICSVWNNNELIIHGLKNNTTTKMNVLSPYTTGFTNCGFPMLSTIFQTFGKCTVTAEANYYKLQFISCYEVKVNKSTQIPDKILVLNWTFCRLPYILTFILVSIILAII
jgi:hypothetical protein